MNSPKESHDNSCNTAMCTYLTGHSPAHALPDITVWVAGDGCEGGVKALPIHIVKQSPAFQRRCPPCLTAALTQFLSLQHDISTACVM